MALVVFCVYIHTIIDYYVKTCYNVMAQYTYQ